MGVPMGNRSTKAMQAERIKRIRSKNPNTATVRKKRTGDPAKWKSFQKI
ncbi:MAG: hypothetical protein AB7C89_06805 [Intestinibacillus sp.]